MFKAAFWNTDDLGSIPITHKAAITMCNSSSKGSDALFGSLQAHCMHMGYAVDTAGK